MSTNASRTLRGTGRVSYHLRHRLAVAAGEVTQLHRPARTRVGRSHAWRTLGLMVLCAGLTACAGKAPPKIEIPTDVIQLEGTLAALPDVNPGPDGVPAPVLVRIYELASDDAFNRTDFFTLFDHEQAVLGAALLRVRDFQLVPGQQVDISGQADPRTQVVGVIAALRDLDAARWRVAAPLPPKTVKPSLPHRVGAQIAVTRAGVALQLGPPVNP